MRKQSKPKPPKTDRPKSTTFVWNQRPNLPVNYPCQIYPRVSTQDQMTNVSVEMQKDKSFALACGWTDDKIILDDSDLGVSGQIRMEDRVACTGMLRRITNGEIKAVVVTNVDRLFRDEWGTEYGKFMEICFRYGVVVVTPDFVYDFDDEYHRKHFKNLCESAWDYLRYHVYGRMLKAKDYHGAAGYWTGHNVPMGYIVDTRDKIDGAANPNYYRYMLYEPHACVIRWIFQRFHELNGNVSLLMGELIKKSVLFPDFDESVDEAILGAYINYTKVEGGYKLISPRGLRGILMNRTYIGQWVYKGEVIPLNIENYPPTIVDIDVFTYAYNRLSKTKLDGTPNENAVEGRGKSYAKKHYAERPAILKEIICAAQPELSIYVRDQVNSDGVQPYYYLYYDHKGGRQARNTFMIHAGGLDNVVLKRLREHMQSQPDTQKDLQDFIALEEEVASETSETLKDIERDITATKALIARIYDQIRSGKLTDPDLAEAANNSYIAAKEDLKRLESRKEATSQIANEDKERHTYRSLMREVDADWDRIVMPEDHPHLVHLFVKSVTVDAISPYFFLVTIEWKDSSWGIDQGICCKGGTASLRWTDEETTLLKANWLTATRQELVELLPRRSFIAMQSFMVRHGLATGEDVQRPNGKKELGVPYRTSLEDWKVMQKYGLTEDETANLATVKLVAWLQ